MRICATVVKWQTLMYVIRTKYEIICISTNHVCISDESTSKTGVKVMVGIPTNT